MLHRVQSLPPPSASRNARCVDLDDLLELANATWAEATKTWTAHLDFLYQRHANLYRVKEEMRFANDNGLEDRDAVLARRPSGIAPLALPHPSRARGQSASPATSRLRGTSAFPAAASPRLRGISASVAAATSPRNIRIAGCGVATSADYPRPRPRRRRLRGISASPAAASPPSRNVRVAGRGVATLAECPRPRPRRRRLRGISASPAAASPRLVSAESSSSRRRRSRRSAPSPTCYGKRDGRRTTS